MDTITPQIQPSKSTDASDSKDKFPDLSLPAETREENAFAALRMSMDIAKTGVPFDVIPNEEEVAMDWEDSSSSSGTKRAASKICDPMTDVVVPLLSRVFGPNIDLNNLPISKMDVPSPFIYMDLISSVINDFAATIATSDFDSFVQSQPDLKESESWDSTKQKAFNEIKARRDITGLILFWLMTRYEKNEKEFKKADKSAPDMVSVSEILREIRTQCINYAILVITNVFTPSNDRIVTDSVLLPFVLNQWNSDFIIEMIHSCFKENNYGIEGTFRQVFEPLLYSLWQAQMNVNSFANPANQQPLQALNGLLDVNVGAKRPVCLLLVSLKNWMPENLTPSFGAVNISRLSILGPFLGLSVFAEDDPKIVDTFYGSPTETNVEMIRMANMQLNKYLETARSEMFGIFESLLRNQSTRNACITFIAEVLARNHNRAQMQFNEKQVSSDGFMMNLNYVLQKFAIGKLKADKVDLLFPYNPQCKLKLRHNDTCLKMSSSEYEEWAKEIASGEFKEIKFHSECYFLALISHHLSVIPLIRKYIRRIRQIREYTRIADELEQSSNSQPNDAMAQQRRRMLTRLHQQNRRLAR